MINSLTEQQVAQLAIYREKWLSIGLSTEPTDIPAAEDAVRLCYKMAGLTIPQSIICMDSPLSAVLNEQVTVGNRSRNQVCDESRNQVWNHVDIKVSSKVNPLTRNLVWKHVGDQVWDYVVNQTRNHILSQVKSKTYTYFFAGYGFHDAGWLSFYDYFREVCGLTKETEELTGLIALAKCCGWWTPYKDIVIIQHRPCFIGLDDDKQLHCDNGMAIKYRDGFGIWAIHGVSVDEQIVMKPAEQTVSQIRDEENVEVKRIRIERFGWNRYLIEINAKVIDSRHNDIENTEETLVKTPDGMTILLPTCKTGRLFSLEVPSGIFTCGQAQKWLHSGSLLDIIVGKTRVVGRS